MKESVAIAKDVDAKKDFLPTRSGNSIHRVRNEPEKQLGSLRSVIVNIRHDGGTPSLDSIATELSSMHTAQRASVLLALQRTHGNRYVQRVVTGIQAKLKVGQPGDVYEQEADRVADRVIKGGLVNSFSHSCPSAVLEIHRQQDFTKAESSPEATVPLSNSKSTPRPTGIKKTEVYKHNLHFGAHYKHTLKSSGGNLEGIIVNETVTNIKDDFDTKLPGVKLSDVKREELKPVDKEGAFKDRIWISFGAIAPAVNRLRKEKKPWESLLGEKVDHQELYYWDNRKPPDWKKFTNDVKIEQRLYDLPGLVVVTEDNDVPAHPEKFSPFPPRSEEKRQPLNINGNKTSQNFMGPGILQPKLGIGQPGDIYEQEAGRMAEQVMRMPEPRMQRQAEEEEELIQTKPLAEQVTPLVQRQIEEEDEEEEEEILRTKEVPGQTPEVTLNLESRINAAKDGGQPLLKSVRSFFEAHFGYNFSHVRIHSNTEATEIAKALNAKAFTSGRDIVFGSGQYAPETLLGKRLLAHELTHVVQQKAAQRPEHQTETGGKTQSVKITSTGAHLPVIMSQQGPAPPAGTTTPEATAQAAAFMRCQIAYNRLAGILPSGLPGRVSPAQRWQMRARSLAVQLFEMANPNMANITKTVEQMRNRLSSPTLPMVRAQRNDPYCGLRSGYVINNRPPVYLCPAFYSGSAEQRIKTMVHEAAHLAGIGNALSEEYCPIFDCNIYCGGMNMADSWSHFVHCLSGQPADRPMVTKGTP